MSANHHQMKEKPLYPSIRATETFGPDGFSYVLQNDEIEIESDIRVPKALRRGAPYTWANGRCHLTVPRKTLSILRISRGYEWDGISIFDEVQRRGFRRDVLRTLNRETLAATIHHDAIYEALRKRVIPPKPADWEAAYRWADDVQLEILDNESKLNETERVLWAFHLRKAQGGAARPSEA